MALAAIGAASILSLLLERMGTGRGGYLDLSQIDTTGFMLTRLLADWQTAPPELRNPGLAHHDCRAIRLPGNGGWIFLNNRDWERGSVAAERLISHNPGPCLSCPESEAAEMRPLLHAAHDIGVESLLRAMRDSGIDCALARNAEEVFASPDLAGFWSTITHADTGTHRYDSSPFVFEGKRHLATTVPTMGESNRRVPGAWLSLSATELDALEADEVLLSQPPARAG